MQRPYRPVPSTREVVPGAHVNIVLKEDQPTGRTVSGTVRDLLTRGNHPRGIKVRLADGRVGRVQSIAPGSAVPEAAGEASALQHPSDDRPRHGPGRRGGWGDESEDVPSHQVGLDAYIKPAKQKGRGKGKAAGGSGELGTGEGSEQSGEPGLGCGGQQETATCPVCNDFQGDEAAVAHHVASHFDA